MSITLDDETLLTESDWCVDDDKAAFIRRTSTIITAIEIIVIKKIRTPINRDSKCEATDGK